MRTSLAYALAAGLSAVCAPSAHAGPGDAIGSATLIENLVTADYARFTRTLATGDAVRQDEFIEVGLDARSEFSLADETRLALGSGSKLKLDHFVYDPDNSAGSIIINMAKGTLRWVTGNARKPSYVIRTPNASITVRGTIFDLFVTDAGETWLLLHEGAVQVCNDRGQCRVHEETCKLTQVSETGEVARPAPWSRVPGAKDNMFHRAFPFVVLPPKMESAQVCSRDAIMRQRDAAAPPPVRQKAAVLPEKPSHALKPAKPDYVPPRREARIVVPKPRPKLDVEIIRKKPIRVVERPKPKPKYPDYDHKPKRDNGKLGKAVLGAVIIGGAIALGSRKGGGKPHY